MTGTARIDRATWIRNTTAEMMADEQYAARGMFPQLSDGTETVTVVNTPIVSEGAPRASRLGPRLGQDTHAVLSDLGITNAEIAHLDRELAVGVPRVQLVAPE